MNEPTKTQDVSKLNLRKMTKYWTLFTAIVALSFTACNKDDGNDGDTNANVCSTTDLTYNANIKPIIDIGCAIPGCHAGGSPNGDFTTYAGLQPYIANGQINSRVVIQQNMPPGGMSQDNIDKIDCWLQGGGLE